MKKVYGLLLIVISLLVLTACGKSANEIPVDEPNDEPVVIEATDFFLVDAESSEYTIVYPEGSDEMVQKNAVAELKFFFKQATDINLPSISDKKFNV